MGIHELLIGLALLFVVAHIIWNQVPVWISVLLVILDRLFDVFGR